MNKGSQIKTENPSFFMARQTEKNSYPGSYSLSEMALNMFMFIGNLVVSN